MKSEVNEGEREMEGKGGGRKSEIKGGERRWREK